MEKKLPKKRKKETKERSGKKIGMYVQIIFTMITLVVAVAFLFQNELLIFLQTLLALDMFIMAYNNQQMYKRTNFTLIYVGVGILMLIMIVIGLLG